MDRNSSLGNDGEPGDNNKADQNRKAQGLGPSIGFEIIDGQKSVEPSRAYLIIIDGLNCTGKVEVLRAKGERRGKKCENGQEEQLEFQLTSIWRSPEVLPPHCEKGLRVDTVRCTL